LFKASTKPEPVCLVHKSADSPKVAVGVGALLRDLTAPHAARRALLAVDYGTSKIGLAYAAGLGAPAQPLGVLPVATSATGERTLRAKRAWLAFY
jgi:hypothetical protein